MSTILSNTGIVFPDSTVQTNPAARTSNNIQVFSMYWNNSGSSGNNYTYYIPPNTTAKLTMNTVPFDTHSGANTANSSYTIPISGIYRLSALVGAQCYTGTNFSAAQAINYYTFNIMANGSQFETMALIQNYPYQYNPVIYQISGYGVYNLSAGSVLTLSAYITPYNYPGSGNSGIVQTALSGHLIN